MKVIARHERDDQDIELDDDQIEQTEHEMLLSFAEMARAEIYRFERLDGWTYRIVV